MSERNLFHDRLLGELLSGTALPAPDPTRAPECDLERRRRFLKIVGLSGLASVGSSGLVHALMLGPPGGGDPQTHTCSTTETYSSSSSYSITMPSAASTTYSQSGWGRNYPTSGTQTWTEQSCGLGGGTTTGTFTWSVTGNTATGANTDSNNEPCYTTTVSAAYSPRSPVGGYATFTDNIPSHPSYTSSHSETYSGSHTVSCECDDGMFQPPNEQETAGAPALPPTLQDADVLRRPHETEHRLRLFERP